MHKSDDVSAIAEASKVHEVEFIAIQAKRSDSLDYGDMSKFFDAVVAFFKDEFPQPTEQLTDIQAGKTAIYSVNLKQNPILRLYFVNTGVGEAKGALELLVNTSKQRLEELNIFSAIHIETVGAKRLQEGYRSATSSVTGKIEMPNSVALPAHPSVQEAYLGFVTGDELIKLASDSAVTTGGEPELNRGIFFDNVRDYDEDSEINKGIIGQLESGGQPSFVFKNNGITVVAKEVRRTGNTFTLEDFQIVNGCQTTNILFRCRSNIGSVVVPFRLIASKDPEFVSSIIIGTNKQNEVRDEQFWSLSPFMKSLEEYCREQPDNTRIFVERRENQYRDSTIERKRICKPRELLKAVAAMYLFQPHRAARDYRGVAREFAPKMFVAGHSVVPYHAAALAVYRIDALVRSGKVDRSSAIFKYFILSVIGWKASAGNDIFSQKPKDQEKAGSNARDFILADDKLVDLFKSVAEKLSGAVSEDNRKDREKLRDAIRRDAFFNRFKIDYLAPPSPET